MWKKIDSEFFLNFESKERMLKYYVNGVLSKFVSFRYLYFERGSEEICLIDSPVGFHVYFHIHALETSQSIFSKKYSCLLKKKILKNYFSLLTTMYQYVPTSYNHKYTLDAHILNELDD